ncbi:GNAT family N-acetyltransferase [Primorskyibacter sp. 2E107]
MSLPDVRRLLDWAAVEGWNPGLDDAEAFYESDPDGFFLKEVDGTPVAAISVINHTADFAFLGLYIATPQARGKGHGLDVWAAGIAHAGRRTIGLDGVPAQQANYARSGFKLAGKTVRYHGRLDRSAASSVRLAAAQDLDRLCHLDTRACGVSRNRFATRWFSNTQTRMTLSLPEDRGFATYRTCHEGIKIGPFYASSAPEAAALLAAVPQNMATESVYIDIPDTAAPLSALLIERGFTPVFETARMYRPLLPQLPRPAFYATATLELG